MTRGEQTGGTGLRTAPSALRIDLPVFIEVSICNPRNGSMDTLGGIGAPAQ